MKLVRPLLLVPCLAAVALTSCIVPGDPVNLSPSVGMYTEAPPCYLGDTYFRAGRYKTSGGYQDGAYYCRGNPYSNRYVFLGRNFYGGYCQPVLVTRGGNDNKTTYKNR